jgi:putative DNA-invertase from lambdoid prophage Rac
MAGVMPRPQSIRSALYFRVSSNRQTTENQFEDLIQIAEREGPQRDWARIRELLTTVIDEESRPTKAGEICIFYHVNQAVALQLVNECIYVEQGLSGHKSAKRRPLFQHMKRDAAQHKFDQLLVWKVSRLGRDMREVLASVYELADLGIVVNPVKSQTGPITSTMGKLLWAIQAWAAEMENDERSEAIKAGHARARLEGKPIGRPRLIFRRDEVVRLRSEGVSWSKIAHQLGISAGSARRAYQLAANVASPRENSGVELPRT